MKTWMLLMTAPLLAQQVPYDRILQAAKEPQNWLTYSGSYNGQRYSPLTAITPANAHKLRPAWVYQAMVSHKFETSPLVVDGVMYISDPPGNATALDALTGRPLWRFRRRVPDDIRACCGAANRGLAVLNDLLYMGTLDSHLVAIDIKTGKLRWDVEVVDYRQGYAITVAPLAVKDKIIVGVAGGEYGIRGFLDAYDAKTGSRAWRFYTIPGPGEFGNDTWQGDSWKTGSGATWVTGSFDPALNLIYWGTGNPGPDYNGDVRQGDNLFANSVLALDADTGKRKWHFQFTPHDVNDWDANHVPVQVDRVVNGKLRRLVLVANRNSFYYVLDRETGEFLKGAEFAKQTWAKGLDAKGRPLRLPHSEPTAEGAIVFPGLHGGTNWFSPSYSPLTKLFYVATREEGVYFTKAGGRYRPGEWFSGGGIRGIPKIEPTGAIKALDAVTGRQAWVFPLKSPPWAGLMATAGGVLFGGSSEGTVYALDAKTGKPLWHFQTGGPIFANPAGFAVNGRQHFAIASGTALFAFTLEAEK
ncbi:MAG TPA: PQQ-dependent dehydrogenase, methanol/ethanol family [Bryobacteraceae bacterium]|nr:PQQ-dependent dehydrogenase, methanol/ethanol family [Bryobacteraceae bacterium]